MIKTIRRIYAIIRFGGFKLLLYKVIDRITHKENGNELFYHISEAAQPEKYPHLLELIYCMKTGERMDICHPITFNEKMQWLKIYDATDLKSRLADKYLVREYIKEVIGEEVLIPLLGVWNQFDEIDFDLLPKRFVLKANHGSGWNIVVKDKEKLDISEAKDKFDKWLQLKYAYVEGFEMHYKNIVPKIIAEQYICEIDDELTDFRVFCFNGIPMQVWVDKYSGTPRHIRSIYDTEWNKLPFRCKWKDAGDDLERCPTNLHSMLEMASKLSSGFSFVRIDFYEVNNHLYFGEMTFTPMSGFGTFVPRVYDKVLGSMLEIPK